jgi:hypothetical protein
MLEAESRAKRVFKKCTFQQCLNLSLHLLVNYLPCMDSYVQFQNEKVEDQPKNERSGFGGFFAS